MKSFQMLICGIILTLLLLAATGEGYSPWVALALTALLTLLIIIEQANDHFESKG